MLCKLSVTESNVDLLCATGPWPRLERLVVVLAKLINMNEETHIRLDLCENLIKLKISDCSVKRISIFLCFKL